jgi:hypothetical protein
VQFVGERIKVTVITSSLLCCRPVVFALRPAHTAGILALSSSERAPSITHSFARHLNWSSGLWQIHTSAWLQLCSLISNPTSLQPTDIPYRQCFPCNMCLLNAVGYTEKWVQRGWKCTEVSLGFWINQVEKKTSSHGHTMHNTGIFSPVMGSYSIIFLPTLTASQTI